MSVTTLFPKGRSGNPGGMTSEHATISRDFRLKCAKEAVKRLPLILEIIDNREVAPGARITAWNALNDRGFGKAIQAIAIDGLPEDLPASQMTQAQLHRMIEGDFFGAVEDMLDTKNERFLSLVDKKLKTNEKAKASESCDTDKTKPNRKNKADDKNKEACDNDKTND